MKITKFGHCCLLIEENGLRILTDPGIYTTKQNEIKNIDVVLITHEHSDHLHIESLKAVLKNNPQAKITTNKSVGALLEKEGIVFNIVEDGEELKVLSLKLKGCGKKHAEIYKERSLVENTGYFVGERLFYPGDAFNNPQIPVDILALPVAGPWCKALDAINFALAIKPKKVFPVHDGGLNELGTKTVYNGSIPAVLRENNIEFVALEIDKETEF